MTIHIIFEIVYLQYTPVFPDYKTYLYYENKQCVCVRF